MPPATSSPGLTSRNPQAKGPSYVMTSASSWYWEPENLWEHIRRFLGWAPKTIYGETVGDIYTRHATAVPTGCVCKVCRAE